MVQGTIEQTINLGSTFREIVFSPDTNGLIAVVLFSLEGSDVDSHLFDSIKTGERLQIEGESLSIQDADKVYYHGLTKIVRVA